MSTETLTLLTEIRKRLWQVTTTWLILLLIALHYDQQLLQYLTQPLLSHMHADHLIATSPTMPLVTLMSLSLSVAIGLSLPILAWHLMRFLIPALYPHERKILVLSTLVSLCLFVTGCCFAFFIVQPMLFDFLGTITPPNVALLPDMYHTLSTIIQLMLTFGLIFQVPLILFCLLKFEWISPNTIQQWRPHLIVTCFILGMLLTPPDVLSQLLLALPLWLLIEAGLLSYTLSCKKK